MPNFKANEMVRDVIDSALDIVGLPASVIRSGRDELKSLNSNVSNAAGGRGTVPDPLGAVAQVGSAALRPIQEAANSIKSRIDRLGH